MQVVALRIVLGIITIIISSGLKNINYIIINSEVEQTD
jgi:hypothetical protein